MQQFLVPIVTAILILVGMIAFFVHQHKKKEAALLEKFGLIPSNNTIEMANIVQYHQFKVSAQPNNLPYVDGITWRDLNMDDVFSRICVCQTAIGQSFLYHRLHDVNENKRFSQWIDFLNRHDETRKALQKDLSHIGISQANMAEYFSQDKDKALPYPALLYRGLTGLIVALIAGSVLSGFIFSAAVPFFAGAAFLLGFVNIYVYYKTKLALEYELERLSYFGTTLYGCKKIIKTVSSDAHLSIDELQQAYRVFRHIGGKFSRRSKQAMAELAFLQEYFFMIFLIDIHRYRKAVNYIINHRDAFKTIYETVGGIDAAVSVLSYRKSLGYYCVPDIIQENIIDFSAVCHPLIQSPVPNTGRIDRNALITGVNASGKTTFIKTLAINNILGLSIDTCLAKHYALKRLSTLTSVAIADNILEGDSYYIAEIKSLKRILDDIEKQPCVCFIDEVLRGTNTAERLSASTAILNHLKTRDSLCLFTTHDTDLAKSFDADYTNYHFEEVVSETDVVFDYTLKTGVATERNAIRLLKLYAYPDALVEDATKHLSDVLAEADKK